MRSQGWPSVKDRPRRAVHECPMCESDEGHQPSCPFYMPLCACGCVTQHEGEPCNKCKSVIQAHQRRQSA